LDLHPFTLAPANYGLSFDFIPVVEENALLRIEMAVDFDSLSKFY
jgi:hypothetical protein